MIEDSEYRLCFVVSVEADDGSDRLRHTLRTLPDGGGRPPYQRNATDSRRFPKGLAEGVDDAVDRGLIQTFSEYSR